MKNKRKIILLGLVALIILGIIWGIVLYQNRSSEKMESIAKSQDRKLEGIKHYELEYFSYYQHLGSPAEKHYDAEVEKYLTPVLTTVKELKSDFPTEERNKGTGTVSVPYQSFNLNDDEKVWVYATYLDNYICDKVVFVYDKLDVGADIINIKTHFETIEHIPSSAGELKLIVISVIPAEQ